MPADEPPIDRENPDAEAVARGYEARDVHSRLIYALLGGVVACMLVLCAGLWWWHGRLSARGVVLDTPRSAVTSTRRPDAPPLQPQEGHVSLDHWDLRAMRDAEDKTFAALGWTIDPRTKRPQVPATVQNELRRLVAASPATRPSTVGVR